MPQSLLSKEELLSRDETFRRLHEEHQREERRLAAMQEHSQLSEQDAVEMKRIKVHKLYLKDQMEAIRRDWGQRATA